MMKREDGSRFRTNSTDSLFTDRRDYVSVRVSDSAQDASRQPFGLAGSGDSFSDDEDSSGICWFPRRRWSGGRKGESLGVEGAAGAGFSRFDANQSKGRPNSIRSQSAGGRDVACCCCGPRWDRKYRDSSSAKCHGNEKPGLKERAMNLSFLQKFASNRISHQSLDDLLRSPGLSPKPVRILSKNERDKEKEAFVPIWQRRSTTPIKLDLRTGPQDV
uniref:Uncharacterized protein n=1 Tax=Physcomitrium patens TaxID=3218 RepID=A0A2K1KCV2_PHYPA|nr:hypothetical protein PHYPA_010803 [Physcomitrium patens]